jgi:hypothetical protein
MFVFCSPTGAASGVRLGGLICAACGAKSLVHYLEKAARRICCTTSRTRAYLGNPENSSRKASARSSPGEDRVKEILDKLSSYNIFNYLLPGIVLAVLAGRLTHYSFIQQDIVIGAFLYYFIGLLISRVGSLLIEPVLKRFSFVRFADYKDFVAASKNDSKLEVLSESNNSYRTLCAMCLLLLLLKAYETITSHYPGVAGWNSVILVSLLFVMFLFAYRKQTAYITKRVAANLPAEAKTKAAKTNL